MKKHALISSVLALLLLLPSCSRRKTERDPTADTGGGKTVSEILAEEMKNAASLAVPLEVDCHTGKTWYDAK